VTSRNLPDYNGKIAKLGYCLGALMIFLTAVRQHGLEDAVVHFPLICRVLFRIAYDRWGSAPFRTPRAGSSLVEVLRPREAR